jgi:undecaprenyl-diphosphatase
MPWASNMGSGASIFIVAVILLLFKKKECRIAGIFLLAGLTVSYYLTDSLKDIIARPRPFMVLPDVNVLENAKNFSFPSTHATQSFMAATVLSRFFRRYVLFFGLAAIVAFSRVYMGVHYVSDVAAGAFLGTSIGYIFILTNTWSSVNIVK